MIELIRAAAATACSGDGCGADDGGRAAAPVQASSRGRRGRLRRARARIAIGLTGRWEGISRFPRERLRGTRAQRGRRVAQL